MTRVARKRLRRRKRRKKSPSYLPKRSPLFAPHPLEKKKWSGHAATVPGLSHLSRGIPCQDEAKTGNYPRPWLFAADGMGSSSSSQWGSASVSNLLPELADTFDPLLKQALDEVDIKSARKAWDLFKRWFYRHLVARQRSLAKEKGGVSADYRYTLAMALVGSQRIGYLQIGDAVLLAHRAAEWEQPCPPREGAFANQTSFVGSASELNEAEGEGLLDARGIDGLIAFTDGVSSQALGLRNQNPAPALDALIEDARDGMLKTDDLYGFLANPRWNDSTCDDRSLALLWPN